MSATPTSKSLRRTFFVGVNAGYVADGTPDQRMIAFYQERSSPLLSCAIVGNVVIPGGYGVNSVTPRMSGDSIWKKLASAIRAEGTVPGIQLATTWQGYAGATSFRPKDWTEVIAKSREIAAAVRPAGLKQLFADLRTGSALAVDAGFKHIQLHAAHGYLFSLLLDARLYDGASDCLSLVADWTSQIQGMGLETSIRISLKTGDAGFDAHGASEFHRQASALPVGLVDVSSGFYNIDKRLIYPSVTALLQDRHDSTAALARRFPETQFIVSGRAFEAVKDLPGNVHLGLCRDLIANPRFLYDPSIGCQNSGKCHYHSRGADSVTCTRWGKLRAQQDRVD